MSQKVSSATAGNWDILKGLYIKWPSCIYELPLKECSMFLQCQHYSRCKNLSAHVILWELLCPSCRVSSAGAQCPEEMSRASTPAHCFHREVWALQPAGSTVVLAESRKPLTGCLMGWYWKKGSLAEAQADKRVNKRCWRTQRWETSSFSCTLEVSQKTVKMILQEHWPGIKPPSFWCSTYGHTDSTYFYYMLAVWHMVLALIFLTINEGTESLISHVRSSSNYVWLLWIHLQVISEIGSQESSCRETQRLPGKW